MKRKWRSLGFKCLPFSPFVNLQSVFLSAHQTSAHAEDLQSNQLLDSVRFGLVLLGFEIEHEPKVNQFNWIPRACVVMVTEAFRHYIGPHGPIFGLLSLGSYIVVFTLFTHCNSARFFHSYDTVIL